MAWGWRVCFLASFVLVLFGMFIRTRLHETPEFAQVKETHKEAKLPIVEMFKGNTSNVLLGLGARHVDGVFFNIFSVFSISYLVSTIGISRGDALSAVMVGAAVLTICIPIAGHLSDKISRAKLYAFGTFITTASVFPAFYALKHSAGNPTLMWIAIIVPYGILYSLVYGNVAALQCDLLTAKVRYTGISFVYQMTSVVAGMTALIATALVKMNDGDPWLVCWYVVGSGTLSALCAWGIAKRNANKYALA